MHAPRHQLQRIRLRAVGQVRRAPRPDKPARVSAGFGFGFSIGGGPGFIRESAPRYHTRTPRSRTHPLPVALTGLARSFSLLSKRLIVLNGHRSRWVMQVTGNRDRVAGLVETLLALACQHWIGGGVE